MAERNTGPVKPPVLDLPARDTTPRPEGTARPEAAPGQAFHWPAALTGIVGGALLGTAITYGLFSSGVVRLPAETDPRIAALEKQLAEASDANEGIANTLTQRFGALQNDLNARLEAANEALAAVKAQAPANAPDLSAFKTQLDALNARIESLPTNAGEAASGELDTMKQGLAALTGKLGTLEAKVGSTEDQVAQLSAEAQKPAEPSLAQVPLLLSSLESAFANGRPYASELSALRAALPDAMVPEALAARADAGIERPDAVARAFAEVLPDMLAATPGRPDADWGAASLDWLKSVFAFRPAGEIAGTSPEAIASQLEAAIGRRDFGAAAKLLDALPEPMRVAGGDIGTQISTQAEAQALLDALREKALAPAGATP